MQVYCQRCGFILVAYERIKSKHTGLMYCSNFVECDRRSRRENLTYEEIKELADRVASQLR